LTPNRDREPQVHKFTYRSFHGKVHGSSTYTFGLTCYKLLTDQGQISCRLAINALNYAGVQVIIENVTALALLLIEIHATPVK